MNTPFSKNIPYLDGWRGLAIVFVLFSHFGDPDNQWEGKMGVLLFFVLSGFLMTQLLFIKKVALKDFFVRRLSRIVPTFWLYTLSMVVYAATFQPSVYHVQFPEVASTLTFLRTYLPYDKSIWLEQWPIGHLWSLNVEEHFYLFLAVGALLCRQVRKESSVVLFLLASTATALALNLYYATNPPGGASPWQLRSECAALGLIAASALTITREQSSTSWIKNVPPWLPVLTFLVAIACFINPTLNRVLVDHSHGIGRVCSFCLSWYSVFTQSGLDTVAPLCLAFSLVYLDQVPQILRMLLSSYVLRWFGTCSFSLYLWQHPFYLARGANPFLAAGLAIGVGALSFYIFENPLRLSLNRAWNVRQERKRIESVALMNSRP